MLVECPCEVDNANVKSPKLAARLQPLLGDQKIDVFCVTPQSQLSATTRHAIKTGAAFLRYRRKAGTTGGMLLPRPLPSSPRIARKQCLQSGTHRAKGLHAGYTKGSIDIFSALLGQLDFAKNNAIRALQAAEANHTDNPTTKVHELVDFPQNIKVS